MEIIKSGQSGGNNNGPRGSVVLTRVRRRQAAARTRPAWWRTILTTAGVAAAGGILLFPGPVAAQVAPPVISSIAVVSNGPCSIAFSTTPGVFYAIQAGATQTGPFVVLGTVTGSGGLTIFNDAAAGSFTSRYYRVVLNDAPVYSLNEVGFVRVAAAAGVNSVFNPFDNVQLQGAMPSPPDTTETFFPSLNDPTNDCFYDLASTTWYDLNGSPVGTLLIPALASFQLLAPVSFSFTLAGEVAVAPTGMPPSISIPPQNQSIAAGQAGLFSVSADGTAPLVYQWLLNGTNLTDNSRISGSQTAGLAISNAQPADAGGYLVVVSNSYGSVTSSLATLTVNAALRAYLKFDESSGATAADSTGNGWTGTLVNGPAFAGGFSNNAVSLNGSSQYVSLPAGVVAGLTDFTVATWVKLNSVSTWARIFDFGDNTTVYMFLTPQSSSGGVRYAITTKGNGPGAEQQINGTSALPTGQWHHVAVTLSGTMGILYVDGSAVGTNSAMTINPGSLGSTTQNWIGRSQYSADPYLSGLVDDFRIYDGALSASDVQALATVVAPAFASQPQNQAVMVGSNATFSALVTGSAPLAYQWQFNGANLTDSSHISGSQSNILTVSGVQFSDEGAYALTVTNAAGPLSVTVSLVALSPGPAFVPIPLTSGSYNRDMVVEKTARAPLVPGGLTTESMEGGTANTGLTWYEKGFDLAAAAAGLPPAGSTITSVGLSNHVYRMPPTYAAGNNVLMIDSANNTSGNFKLSSSAAYAALSFLASSANSVGTPMAVAYTVSHSDGSRENGTLRCYDWFLGNAGTLASNATVAFGARGRVNAQTYAFDTINASDPVLYSMDIPLTNTSSFVTNILLQYTSGLSGSHSGFFAISGAGTPSGPFNPIAVTGYNRDAVMEASAAGPLTNATTATMDAGVANTGNTWYEKGYDPASPTTGLPAAGSTFANASAPDRSYILAPSYTLNNTVLIDSNSPTATITPAGFGRYSALSILHATGNASPAPTIQCVVNHLDGTAETGIGTSLGWQQAAVPYAFTPGGRINLDTRIPNDIGTTSPRLYFSDFNLANTNSAVTSLAFTWLNGSASSHTAIFAVSGVPAPITSPALSWSSPAPIVYGQLLSSNQLNATANVPGTFSYSPPSGTALDAGTQTLSVVFAPNDAVDYFSVTSTVSLAVLPAPLSVTANNTNRVFGQPNPVLTGTILGLQNGDNISATYACAAGLTSPPGPYAIVPSVLDPYGHLHNYTLATTSGTLTVTSGAQVLAHDDAAAYVGTDQGSASGMNLGYGFLPWVITTSGSAYQGAFIGDGGNIATINNSAWGLYAQGTPMMNAATAFRGFSNSLPVGLSFRLEWRTGDIGFNDYNFAGFSLRTGNASSSTSDYRTGERFAFYYQGGGTNVSPQDDVRIRDGSGEAYAPAPGVAFGAIHQGIAIEFTLLSSNTYRLLVMDAATSNTIALFDNRTLAGSGTIDSVALFDNQTDPGGGEYDGDQMFNNMEISFPSSPVLPSVSVTPGSLAVAPGSPATFTANALGTPPLVYQWQFNGVNVPGANASSLAIASAQVGNAGQYRVMVTSPYGSVTSSPSTLAVLTPTSILIPPANAQVNVGSSATFSVVALSSSPLTYQWFFEGAPISGATNSSYTKLNAQLTDAGTYSVQVANQANSIAAASAALLVEAPPPPSVPQSAYTITIQPGTNLIANQLDHGGNTLNEIMPGVPDGTAVSKYDNASGTWSSSTYNANVGAWVPSSIVLRPGEGALLVSPASFNLSFTGTPHVPVLPLNIPHGTAWLVSRQTNDVGTYENIVGVPPDPGAVVYKWNPSTASYTLYSFVGPDWFGGVAPTAAVGESLWIGRLGGAPVAIPVPPSITQQPLSLAVAQGGSATFTVVATGTEPLFYQWQLNGNGIPSATDSFFAIPNVQAANAGNYSVVIHNSIGVTNSAIAKLTLPGLGSLPVADNFVNAGSLGPSTNGTGTASNLGATTEPGEPTPDNIPFGGSVWLSWQPQVSGIASLTTAGSFFDTVLAVFTGSALNNLHLVAADDDGAPNLCSALTFNATAGTTYYLQLSGYHGAQGNLSLSWNLLETNAQAPTIIAQPQPQTQTNGGPVTLSVVVTNIGAGVSYQWALKGALIPGATSATLTISNLTPELTGLYTVGVTNVFSLAGVASVPASVEIFNPGAGQPGNFANVHPQDKFLTATALTPHDPNVPNDPTFAGGFTGTQIFSSSGATSDQGEPNHCGYPPCHSVWYSYQPPTSGLLTIFTTNNFNAILEVYSGSGTSFATLVPVACSANHGTAGEMVSFGVTAGTQYWVVVDGVNCASGSFSVGYTLSAAPGFTAMPVSQTAKSGTMIVLSATAVGAPPFGYQWRFNGGDLTGATGSTFVIPSFQAGNQGNYTVMTTNSTGTNVSAPAAVYLSDPPRFVSVSSGNGSFSMRFVGALNSNYVLQASSNLKDWVPLKTNSSPVGILDFTDPNTRGFSSRYYRTRPQ